MRKKVKITLSDLELIPVYCTKNAAGADLRANIESDITIAPGMSKLIPTGIFLEIPEGFEVQIRPRSGLALKSQITVLNTPGTIDSDYRGEIGVILINHGKTDFIVTSKMRIAQLILAPVYQMDFVITNELIATERGSGGFGHSGTN
jgi:dUTP pyrophosphatase